MPDSAAASSWLGLVLLVLVLLTPLAIAGGLVWFFLARKRKEAARLEAMSPAERELHEATLEHAALVRNAEAAHRAVYDQYQASVAAAEQNLAAANQIGLRELGRYNGRDAGILLYENQIAWAPAGGQWSYFPLDASVTARADASGAVWSTERSTATRMIAGGVVLGGAGLVAGAAARKTQVNDGRELYLLVDAAEYSLVVTCMPDHGQYIRQLAAQITNAGKQAKALQEQRPLAVAAAQTALDAAKAATAEVNAVAATAEAARAGTGRIEAARSALAIEAPKPDVQQS